MTLRPSIRAALLYCLLTYDAAAKEPVDQVDPFIGTLGEGNVFAGATLPFGFLQPGPDTGPGSGASGYKHDKPITGFSQQHISGMGGPLYGHLSLMPVAGAFIDPARLAAAGKSDEVATPGYYAVTLQPSGVRVELTATRHVALHRHTFPAGAARSVALDIGHVLYGAGKPSWNSARPVKGEVRIDPARREVSGHMTYQGGRSSARRYKIHFVARFDQAFADFGAWTAGASPQVRVAHLEGERIGAWLRFAETEASVVGARVALSYTGLEQAHAYLEQETHDVAFERARMDARAAWGEVLGKITVEGGTRDQRTQFHSAMYRIHMTPNDWTGEAPARYGTATYYENMLCLWDTFRTVNPLLTLIQPTVQAGIVNTLINYYKHDGWTGDAHSAHHYEHVQNGSSADVVVADAFVKKLPGIDWRDAYAAIRKNAFVDDDPAIDGRPDKGRFRLDDYRKHGYVPVDASSTYKAIQAVSRTLEYAHNDHAVLTLARRFGSTEDVAELERRVLWYRNVWDGETRFMRGKRKDGSWLAPFDPVANAHGSGAGLWYGTGEQYYEGSAWTWSWHVPHDVQGLITLNFGNERFVERLRTAVDRHYEAYNEPGMLQTFLFSHAGRPDLTQHYSRHALRHFSATPAGLPGNDDSGTTSAWLVWAMLGLYPNAGQDWYYIGSPVFTRAQIHLADGKRVTLEAPAASVANKYIAALTVNGRAWTQPWIRHADLVGGATLKFTMSDKPGKWGSAFPPPSHSRGPGR
ncbi:GH92 family glycosyl hydrolase [Pseudoduganella lutea]|nr:GH92 family glycosyl hydrolase [Pseudoduganella lutea]